MYPEKVDHLSPGFDFTVAFVESKTWFHSLHYAGEMLSDSHIDVIFHYFRKKAAVTKICKCSFTTTDVLFQVSMERAYAATLDKTFCWSSFASICDTIGGLQLPYSKPWDEVEHVLMPLYIKKQMHWILARFCIKDWCIYVYNSLNSYRDASLAKEVVKPLLVMLPLFFRHMDHFSKHGFGIQRDIKLNFVPDLPVQLSNMSSNFHKKFN
ncbi:unnamed protein product [Cuscuta epithymum]|uniref:Ubiquitin-like protease family profile domain-containing protein n=1 Tax=Cuscuta epithymum TaxID=186058 RepID=A0AAV0FZM5_9ASTE|nr:unnamed protein product [Cuscuta epithymum]CAH9140778.1 unnamed protein product [Cuscuta epithymum]